MLQVAACKDTGYDWFEQLLQNVSIFESNTFPSAGLEDCRAATQVFFFLQLLKSEEDSSYKPARKACVQLVDNLVEYILKYEEALAGMQILTDL